MLKKSKHGYYVKSTHGIEEVLSKQITPTGGKRKENKVIIDGDSIYMDSHRYWVFKEKGCNCVICGAKGLFFRKETTNKEGIHFHFNLYAINKKGEEVLMTKDHIIPKSKGGANHINNYQLMCQTCNVKKGNLI